MVDVEGYKSELTKLQTQLEEIQSSRSDAMLRLSTAIESAADSAAEAASQRETAEKLASRAFEAEEAAVELRQQLETTRKELKGLTAERDRAK